MQFSKQNMHLNDFYKHVEDLCVIFKLCRVKNAIFEAKYALKEQTEDGHAIFKICKVKNAI